SILQCFTGFNSLKREVALKNANGSLGVPIVLLQAISPPLVIASLPTGQIKTPFSSVRQNTKLNTLMERILKKLPIAIKRTSNAFDFNERIWPVRSAAECKIDSPFAARKFRQY
ncbi:MAG TPA: hypothetical protein PKC48_13375, partial [Sphingorhabdus sp.]|nr:hypothetical protein [Sphingorhabdus sp.]